MGVCNLFFLAFFISSILNVVLSQYDDGYRRPRNRNYIVNPGERIPDFERRFLETDVHARGDGALMREHPYTEQDEYRGDYNHPGRGPWRGPNPYREGPPIRPIGDNYYDSRPLPPPPRPYREEYYDQGPPPPMRRPPPPGENIPEFERRFLESSRLGGAPPPYGGGDPYGDYGSDRGQYYQPKYNHPPPPNPYDNHNDPSEPYEIDQYGQRRQLQQEQSGTKDRFGPGCEPTAQNPNFREIVLNDDGLIGAPSMRCSVPFPYGSGQMSGCDVCANVNCGISNSTDGGESVAICKEVRKIDRKQALTYLVQCTCPDATDPPVCSPRLNVGESLSPKPADCIEDLRRGNKSACFGKSSMSCPNNCFVYTRGVRMTIIRMQFNCCKVGDRSSG